MKTSRASTVLPERSDSPTDQNLTPGQRDYFDLACCERRFDAHDFGRRLDEHLDAPEVGFEVLRTRRDLAFLYRSRWLRG